MANASERSRMRNRGLLTKADREALLGDRDVDDQRLADIKYNIRQRMDNIEEDLQILRRAGEDDLVAKFYDSFARASQLEQRIEELEERLEDGT